MVTNYGKLALRLNLHDENVDILFFLSNSLSYLFLFLLLPVTCAVWVPLILFLDYYSGGSFSFLKPLLSWHSPPFRVFWWYTTFLITVSLVSSCWPSKPSQASYFLYNLSSTGEPQLCLAHASFSQSFLPPQLIQILFQGPAQACWSFLLQTQCSLFPVSYIPQASFITPDLNLSGKPFLPIAHSIMLNIMCGTSKNLGFYPLAIYPSSVA